MRRWDLGIEGWEIGKLEDMGPLEDVKVIVSDERCVGDEGGKPRKLGVSGKSYNYCTSVSSFITRGY